MIRFIFVVLTVLLFLLLSSPILLVEEILGKYKPEVKDRQCLAIVQWAFRLILWISGTKVEVEGKENIPADQAVLFVGNHRSYFDILVGYTTVPGLMGFVAKKEMTRYPFLRIWMKDVHCLFLDRKDVREALKAILTGIDKIKEGVSMWIFPEGTRNENEQLTDLLPFREGSLKIAEKAGCLVIPVAIQGSADCFENHLPLIRPQHVKVHYGKPIDIKGLPKEEKKKSGAYVRGVIIEMLEEMQKEDEVWK